MARAAITGIGVVAPGEPGVKKFWDLLVNGDSAIRSITLFDARGFRSQVAAECDFDAAALGLHSAECQRADRYVQMAKVAAAEAWRDSGLDLEDVERYRLGVSMGTAVGGSTRLEEGYVAVSGAGSRWLVDHTLAHPSMMDALVPSSLAAEVASDLGVGGPCRVISTGCTSGLDAVGHGARLIEDGDADVVIAGASDSPITPISAACFDAIKATTPDADDPASASRPFDLRRKGFVLGEGAAVLVLESAERARRRGARCYGEVAGFASRANAYHMTGLHAEGRDMAAAIGAALGEARLPAEAIDYVNAHGSGTKQNDRHETAAVKRSLGAHAYDVAMSSIKSMIGHSLGAIGAIELAACALAMHHGVIPPTANLEVPDPECDLDYVPKVAREASVGAVLSLGSGFGGFQSAVVLTRGLA